MQALANEDRAIAQPMKPLVVGEYCIVKYQSQKLLRAAAPARSKRERRALRSSHRGQDERAAWLASGGKATRTQCRQKAPYASTFTTSTRLASRARQPETVLDHFGTLRHGSRLSTANRGPG